MPETRYLTDGAGNRVAVVLDIEDYEHIQNTLKRFESLPPAVHALLTAPEDDEPYTDEERQAVEQSRASVRAGHVLSHEELRQKLLG